ncbi:MAG: HugZ family protein [Qingshengfaniella sp.]
MTTPDPVPPVDPIRPTDDAARSLARGLIDTARFGALGVIAPDDGSPQVTRVATGTDPAGHPLILISTLSAHTTALRADPRCSLLLGEPGAKGDPLTHPRLTLTCQARFTEHDSPDYPPLAERWRTDHPKAKLYIGFQDFVFATLRIEAAALNGGFGRAFRLTPADLDV